MLKVASANQYRFNRQSVPSDGKCLFWTILDALKLDLTEENNKKLRRQVAKYILEHEEMHDIALNSVDNPPTIEKYCSDIINVKLWAGEPELYALARSINKVICVTYLSQSNVRTAFFGDENTSATECLYLVHENSHYDLLVMINKEKQTIFKRNDIELDKILNEFIDEYKRKLKESAELSRLFVENPTSKRKHEDEGFQLPITFVEREEKPISNKYYKKNKRSKVSEIVIEPSLSLNENNIYSNNYQNIRFSDSVYVAFDAHEPANKK